MIALLELHNEMNAVVRHLLLVHHSLCVVTAGSAAGGGQCAQLRFQTSLRSASWPQLQR